MISNEKLKSEIYDYIRLWERSGLNQKEFCKAEGINYYKFKYWNIQQNKAQHISQPERILPEPGFIPVDAPSFENIFSEIELSFSQWGKVKLWGRHATLSNHQTFKAFLICLP